jgi:hypothetical protein
MCAFLVKVVNHSIYNSLVPRPHPQKEERVWYTSSAFWGTQDAARHVIVMITHRFGITCTIVGYSAVSHDSHV